MSTTASLVPCSKDQNQEELMQEYCKNLLSTLPKERWLGSSYLYKYNGFWLIHKVLPGLIACQNHFQAQDTDVLLITTPKSGTTWLKALMFALANRKIYPINQNHPLLKQNPHSLVPFMEFFFSPEKMNPDFSCPLGRLYSTHYPLTLLPESVLNSGCKIVYLCRNIKDTFVSYWHFSKKLGAEASLEEFFDMFCEGVSLSGPVWDHVLGYWRESLEKPEKVLFLKFEALQEKPSFHLKLLAEFMGCPISPEEETCGFVDEVLGLCSFDNLSNLEVNKSGTWRAARNEMFFRKGKVGDWKNYLTSEMEERIDHITAQKFFGSGLSL
ncbi:unnamed protein product [Coffea canephora]|uniref:Sulfotransferase n=1 Tax=Coffea canephora TaxID=49390 RepID=A0A068V4Z7_COFCA|nr:unnamed protein product [Coffea canephora]